MSRATFHGLLAAAGLVALAILLRLPAFELPLNRDEGTYALIGDQWGGGLVPYRDVFDNKQPGLYVVYWAIAQVAPQQVGAVRLVAALLGGATAILLLAGLAGRIGTARAAAAAATAALAGATTYVEGYDLNGEHVMVVGATATVLLALALERSPRRTVPLLVGALAGVTVLLKVVFVFAALAALVPLLAGRRARGQSAAGTVAAFAAGGALPVLVVVALFATAGAADDFWVGNVGWNSEYVAAGESSPFALPARLAPVFVLAAGGLVAGAVRLARAGGRDVPAATLLVWLAGALVGAKLGGRDFPHYYAPCIPPAAALLWLPWPRVPRAAALAVGVAAVLLALPFARDAARAFGESGRELSARQYGEGYAVMWGLQFSVGEAVRERARPGDRLFVAGAEPGFYWTARVRPATRHVFIWDYPDVPPSWRGELQRDVCERPPRFVIVPWRPGLDGCLDPSEYRPLLEHDVPGGRLTVLERVQPS